jgi:hypothetical protein
MATILYNDRIISFNNLKRFDRLLDDTPSERTVMDLAETRIRNLLAFSELQHLNDTGVFRFVHPLIVHRSEKAQLEEALRRDPDDFLRLYKCCRDNIRRYEAYLKRDDRIHLRSKDKASLRKLRTRADLFKLILADKAASK